MGRKKRFTIRKLLPMDEALAARITRYRIKTRGLPDETEAIRDLLDQALSAAGIPRDPDPEA